MSFVACMYLHNDQLLLPRWRLPLWRMSTIFLTTILGSGESHYLVDVRADVRGYRHLHDLQCKPHASRLDPSLTLPLPLHGTVAGRLGRAIAYRDNKWH
eukprot:scaffold132315_cov14-Prasinocladus_malaysianus.AAC.2